MGESAIRLADMKPHRLPLIAGVAMVAAFGLSGCDTDDGPAEEMGQVIDQGIDDTGKNIQDTANKAANAVEDACEDVKEGVDATDTNC
jgi:hypothetical protein